MSPLEARSVQELCASLTGAGRAKYVLFWGHRPNLDGSLSQTCLSQWYEAPFVVDDVEYQTAEHYMMAAKARLFRDRRAEAGILSAASPGEAKAIGRSVRGFVGATWEAVRFEVVVDGNVAKFGQNEALRTFLLGTAKRVLAEASPADLVWGIGLDANDPRSIRPTEWPGLNLLGFALMEARQRLAAM